MVSDGYEIYQGDNLVSYIMSDYWVRYLQLIYSCMTTVIEK